MKIIRPLFVWLCILGIGLPLLWVLVSSLKGSLEVISEPWGFPAQPKWSNYRTAWVDANVGTGLLNSTITTVGTLLILLPIGAMAAYVLARSPFRGSKAIFGLFLSGMMFPVFLVIVPLFIQMRTLGLTDSLPGLILVYVAYSLSFTIFVLFGFFVSIPKEMDEAAMLDGCSPSRAFWQIMLPLARPGLIVAGVFNAIGLWNEYGLALVLVNRKEFRTLPLAVADLTQTQQYQADYGALFAALVVVMAPMLIAYLFVKDRLREAMLAGAVKG